MVERFEEYGRSFPVVPSDHGRFVRYSDYAALKAENEILREDNKVLQTEACRAWGLLKETAERALAERAGGVKVKALSKKLDEIRARVEKTMCPTWSSDGGDQGEQGRISREDFDILILSTLTTEPAAPEGRQPVRWEAVDEEGNDNFATSIYEADYKGLLVARCNQNGRYPWQAAAIIRGLEQNKSLTRPAEQAVTEAMVEAAAIVISGGRKDLWDGFGLFKRASFRTRAMHALKAAMEAGR